MIKIKKHHQFFKFMAVFTMIPFLITGCSLWERTSNKQNSSQGISQDGVRQFLSTVRPKFSGEAESYYELGRHFMSKGKHVLALKEFWKAATVDSGRPEYFNALGVCYDSLKEYPLAVMSYRSAIDLKPDFAEAHNNLGYSYYLQGKTDLAKSELMKAVSLNTSNPRYLNNLSLCYNQALDKQQLLALATENQPAPEQHELVASSLRESSESIVVTDAPVEAKNVPHALQDMDHSGNLTTTAIVAETYDTRSPVINDTRVATPLIAVNTSGRAEAQAVSSPPLIEISNGNGVYRMATNLGNYFKAKGFNVVQLTNADRFDYKRTSISYGTGCRNTADYMAKLISGSEYSIESLQNSGAAGKIRVVLGDDIKNLNQLFLGNLPVVVANGNGTRRMAAKVSALLGQKGFKMMRPTNADSFDYDTTCVLYPDGRLACAEFVGRELPGKSRVQYAASNSNAGSIKVIIGKDINL